VSFAHRFSDFTDNDEEGHVRAVALDVHRDFCEVAIGDEDGVRAAGRIKTAPDELELFAQSLDRHDHVARGERRRLGGRAHLGAARRARDRRLAV
jgi:hypothetical protein